MVKTSTFVQTLWTCNPKGQGKSRAYCSDTLIEKAAVATWDTTAPSSLYLPKLPAPVVMAEWDLSASELFQCKVQELNSSCPDPLGILCFKHWAFSWSSLELSVFSVCWLHDVGGILWERGSNILNWHSYFQNNHFHAPLPTEAGTSFASFRLLEQNSAFLAGADFHLRSESCKNTTRAQLYFCLIFLKNYNKKHQLAPRKDWKLPDLSVAN